MQPSALSKKLDGFERLPLAEFPTPLEKLAHLSQDLGREIYIKRDDIIGPGLGGNKTRKLEYLLPAALASKKRKLVTFGGLQSNHTRITAAAARKVGLEPHIFYFEPRPDRLTGNLLINHYLGAKMHFFPLGGGGGMSLEMSIRLVRWLARLRLGPHAFIPVGGHAPLGAIGYTQAALEIHQQALAIGLRNPILVVAAGSGGTLAGLWAGLTLLESPVRLLGIDVGKLWKGFPASIAHLAGEVCALLGLARAFNSEDVPLIEERYVGEKYARPSPECLAATRRLARMEGILLDPVYTAKAFAGLLDLLAHGSIGGDGPIIFLHTGGLPGIFAFDYHALESPPPG